MQSLLESKRKYSIILCDAPWSYADKKANDPKMGGITYPVMSLEAIKSLPVAQLADKDCALFMWVTMPMLQEGLDVIRAWGFKYRTCAFTWVKQNPKSDGIYSGLGHWTNGNAELCLFAKKGAPKRVAKDVKQIVIAHRGRHSTKPPEVKERIVKLMGDLPRIELFARDNVSTTLVVDGWDYWGNAVDLIVGGGAS
jgi:N6-adenosine-specific RNA methylase IME4